VRRGSFIETFPVTSAIVIVCVGLYALEVYFEMKSQDVPIGRALGFTHADILADLGASSYNLSIREGQVWRLVSCAFLHGFALHILFNLWVLTDLGRLLEPMLGRERFLVAYISSAIGGSLASAAWTKYAHHAGTVSVGASGAILGMVGLLLAYSIRHRDRDLRDQIIRMLVYMAVFTYLASGGLGGMSIDHSAHIGGFLIGAAFGFFTPRYVSSRSSSLWKYPFWVTVVVTAGSVGAGVWTFLHSKVR
jgi:rhomboid protease GluP